MREVPQFMLPKVFQDAIEVAQQAKVCYIWIDSLCIIQDSPADWESESAKMGDIYAGALFNISATGFEDGSFGLFVERDPRLVEPIQLFMDGSTTIGNFFLGPGQYALVDGRTWLNSVELAPLHSRAWVVQERILAHRVLHFGWCQLFWECSECQMCESIPHGIASSFMGVATIKGLTYPQLSKGWPVDKYMSYWSGAVALYSRSHLTLDSDKMIAISGLARKLQEASNGLLGMYLAGLWRNVLVSQLTWNVRERMPRPPLYRCPSWSWLHTNSGVRLPFLGFGRETNILTAILDCVTFSHSGDEYSLLRAGHLKLLCPLLCLELVHNQKSVAAQDDGSLWLCPASNIQLGLDFLMDAQDEFYHLTTNVISRNEDENIWWRLARPLDTQTEQLKPFYLAIVHQHGDRLMEGLALRPTDSNDGTFQRWGAFTWVEASGEALQANLDALETAAQDLPIPLCGSRKPDGRYEITIV